VNTHDTPPLLAIEDLRVSFHSSIGRINALNGVSFELRRNEVLALLGESGSGKSVTAAAIMGLIEQPPGSIDGGRIVFEGRDLLEMAPGARRRLCGEQIALIFQDALAALNPVFPIGRQLAEMFIIHGRMSHADAQREAVRLLGAVGIPAAGQRAREYPHQFSGGMRQRVMIAMAMALNPRIVIADEPTTALDVTVQAQIVETLKALRAESDASFILITHDLGVVAEMADRVVVMYGGRVVEVADVYTLFADPQHPYTKGLLAAQPRLDSGEGELTPIPGSPPSPAALPSGCAFRPRCPLAQEICAAVVPPLVPTPVGSLSACHFSGVPA
jgi:oligopeptide transport system ATP-binding protein